MSAPLASSVFGAPTFRQIYPSSNATFSARKLPSHSLFAGFPTSAVPHMPNSSTLADFDVAKAKWNATLNATHSSKMPQELCAERATTPDPVQLTQHFWKYEEFDHPTHDRPPYRSDNDTRTRASNIPLPKPKKANIPARTIVTTPEDDVVYDLIPDSAPLPPSLTTEESGVVLADFAAEYVWSAAFKAIKARRDAAPVTRTSRVTRFGAIGDQYLERSVRRTSFEAPSPELQTPPDVPMCFSNGSFDVKKQNDYVLESSSFLHNNVDFSPENVFPAQPSSTFRKFVVDILSSTLLAPEDVLIALNYIDRLELDAIIVPPMDPESVHLPAVRESTVKSAPYKLFLGAAMLANKIIQDNSYRNESYAAVSGFPIKEVNYIERHYLRALDFNLSLRAEKWFRYLLNLRQMATLRHSSGTEKSALLLCLDQVSSRALWSYGQNGVVTPPSKVLDMPELEEEATIPAKLVVRNEDVYGDECVYY